MRIFRSALLVGACSAIVAGAAWAGSREMHVMKVALPDGSVEQIRYTGDVAPRVVVVPAAAAMPVAMLDEPFGMFDRISAVMDAHADAMLRQAAALAQAAPAATGPMNLAAMKNLPAGTVSYSFVSTTSGNGTCTRSVQLTSFGQGEQPKMVSHSSGDCGGKAANAPAMRTTAPVPAAPATDQPQLFKTKLDAPRAAAPKREAL